MRENPRITPLAVQADLFLAATSTPVRRPHRTPILVLQNVNAAYLCRRCAQPFLKLHRLP